MILDKPAILDAIRDGAICVHPFLPALVQGQSIDVRLGQWLYVDDEWIDLKSLGSVCLQTRQFVIAHTHEFIGTMPYSGIHPQIKLKSNSGRHGLVHTLAGFGDVGFRCRWAMEMYVAKPVEVFYCQTVAQVYFNLTHGSGGDYVANGGNFQATNEWIEIVGNWKKEDLLPKPFKIVPDVE